MAGNMNGLKQKIVRGLGEIPQRQWQALAGDDPFLSAAYLAALEDSGCVSAACGWQPRFLTLWRGESLVGAMPLYEKYHSWGEFVFDWAWADVHHSHGLRYYPKLVCGVPFTPVSGGRVLVAPGEDSVTVGRQMIAGVQSLVRRAGWSSWHVLFPRAMDLALLRREGLLVRRGIHFQWRNPGYGNFQQFLAMLKRDKRKRIRQERRQVAAAGITFTWHVGADITPEECRFFARCYMATRRRYRSPPALNEAFFLRIGETLADRMLLVIARSEGRPIAAALNFFTATTLYGRWWGTLVPQRGLHFETCYYQAMAFCIQQGIGVFDGGVQGEHKLARGFLPARTLSAHWLADPGLARVIEYDIARERRETAAYAAELRRHSPFRG